MNAYYEALHERLETAKARLTQNIEELLRAEIAKRDFGPFSDDKYAGYRDACLAFIDERIELYNPIGIQYTFDPRRRRQAFELELQLDWYDSRAEYEALVEAARLKSQSPLAEEAPGKLADELIKDVGAFPDKSIICAYEAAPAPEKLPDYVVARAIEQIIR